MSTDLERELRAMLRDRAGDVRALPERLVDPASTPLQVADRRPRLALLAVAASVLLVVGLTVGVGQFGGGGHPSANPGHLPSSAGPRSTSGGDRAAIRPQACTAALPSSWKQLLKRAAVAAPARAARPLAIGPDGAVLTDASEPNLPSLALLEPGTSGQIFFGLPPAPTQRQIDYGAVDRNWIVYAVMLGQGGGQGPVQIGAIDRTTHRARVLHPAQPGDVQMVLGPALFDGAVYWTEIDGSTGVSSARMQRYDLATGKRSTVDTGELSGPGLVAGGLYWTRNGELVSYRPGTLPPGYTVSPKFATSRVFTDGDTMAWTDPTTIDSVSMWSPDLPRPVTVVRGTVPTYAVAYLGRDVFWVGNAGLHVTDIITGATVLLSTEPLATALARDGILALYLPGSGLSILDGENLPPITC